MKLRHTLAEATTKRFFKTVYQEIDVEVDYNPETRDYEVLSVNVYENGKRIAEISALIDVLEPDILQNIDWPQIYSDHRINAYLFFNRFPALENVPSWLY